MISKVQCHVRNLTSRVSMPTSLALAVWKKRNRRKERKSSTPRPLPIHLDRLLQLYWIADPPKSKMDQRREEGCISISVGWWLLLLLRVVVLEVDRVELKSPMLLLVDDRVLLVKVRAKVIPSLHLLASCNSFTAG